MKIQYKTLELITRINNATSDDVTRPNLQGVFLKAVDSKVRIAATDGYMMAAYEVEEIALARELKDREIILDRGFIKKIKSEIRPFKKTGFVDCTLTDDQFQVNNLIVQIIQKDYVPYYRVMCRETYSSKKDVKSISFNPKQMIRLLELLGDTNYCTMHFRDPLKPIVIVTKEDGQLETVIMPVVGEVKL